MTVLNIDFQIFHSVAVFQTSNEMNSVKIMLQYPMFRGGAGSSFRHLFFLNKNFKNSKLALRS